MKNHDLGQQLAVELSDERSDQALIEYLDSRCPWLCQYLVTAEKEEKELVKTLIKQKLYEEK
jgi:hypothetical protein